MPGPIRQVTSPFGNRPNSLPTQVPNVGAGAEITDDLAQVAANPPSMRGPASAPTDPMAQPGGEAPQADPLDQLYAEFDAQSTDQYEEEPGIIEANLMQFQDGITRLKAGLAANDQETMGFLKQKFGEDNVRFRKGKAWIRDKAGDKFRALDPDAFEIFGDLIMDMSRGFVEEAAALPAEVAGGAAGAAAGTVSLPVVGTVGGAGAGAYAGRVASGPAQVAAADAVAEAAGIPRDPSRNRAMEMGVQATLEAAMPMVGKWVSKFIPGTAAYNLAKQAGDKELTALSKQSLEVARSVEELAQIDKAINVDGSMVGVPGANVRLGAHQLNPESARIKQLAETAREYPAFVNTMRKHAEEWGSLFEGTMKEISGRAGKGREINPNLAGNIVDAVSQVREIEGKNIAKYKAQALKTLGKKPHQMTEDVVNNLQTIVGGMGFTPSGKPASKEQIQKLVGKFGITTTGEARAIVNNVDDVMTSLQKNGGLNIEDLDRFRTSIGQLSETMQGTPAGRHLAQLSGALRENYKQVIESGIENEFEKVGFRSAMDDYTNIMRNIDVLRSAMNENASARAIVNKFFTGSDNVPRLKAIQSLDPKAFEELKSEWVGMQLEKFKSRENASGFAAGRFLDALDKQYGPEFMNMVFPKQEQKTVRNFLTVMERLDKTFAEGKVDQATERYKQGAINTLIGVMGDVKFKTINGLAAFAKGRSGAEHAAIELLSRDGIEKYVANYPGKIDKAGMTQKLKDFVAAYRINRIIDSPNTARAAKVVGRENLRHESGGYVPEE